MIATAAVSTEYIVNSPGFLRAWHYKPDTSEWVVVVWASILVRFTDTLYQPVRETLSRLDVSAVRVESVYDPLAMSERAAIRVYTVAGRKPARDEPPDLREAVRVA